MESQIIKFLTRKEKNPTKVTIISKGLEPKKFIFSSNLKTYIFFLLLSHFSLSKEKSKPWLKAGKILFVF